MESSPLSLALVSLSCPCRPPLDGQFAAVQTMSIRSSTSNKQLWRWREEGHVYVTAEGGARPGGPSPALPVPTFWSRRF